MKSHSLDTGQVHFVNLIFFLHPIHVVGAGENINHFQNYIQLNSLFLNVMALETSFKRTKRI
jgi:hypothetical protein